jgi:hypothetical protein
LRAYALDRAQDQAPRQGRGIPCRDRPQLQRQRGDDFQITSPWRTFEGIGTMRHHSFGASMRMIARQAARAQRARQRAQVNERAAAVRALRNAERQAKAAVRDREKAIGNLLTRALAKNPTVDLTSVLKSFTPKSFDKTQWRLSAPNRDEFTPKVPSFFARLLPGATGRHEGRVLEANELEFARPVRARRLG